MNIARPETLLIVLATASFGNAVSMAHEGGEAGVGGLFRRLQKDKESVVMENPFFGSTPYHEETR